MVGKSMTVTSREKLASLMHSAKLAIDIPSKLELLRKLKNELPQEDPVILTEFLPPLFDFLSDRFSPVRKFVTEMVGEIGLNNTEFLPDIVPMLIDILDDDTPAVVRQAILCGIDLFSSTLEKIAIQGLYSSELESALESAWECMLKFKDKVYSIAFQNGRSGAKLLALKFVEAVIRLYTLDPNGSTEPTSHHGKPPVFNVSWLRRDHPALNIGDLSMEASNSLGLLLDQLRFPTVKSLSNSVIIVLIKSLSAIAIDRPAFYGRILPVLLSLEPSSSVVSGVCVSAAHLALKKAFLTCTKCTHPSAAPWRDRLAGALKEMQSEGKADQVFHPISASNGSILQREEDYHPVIKEEDASVSSFDSGHINLGRKRPGSQNGGDLAQDADGPGKRVKTITDVLKKPKKELDESTANIQDDTPSSVPASSKGDVDNGPVQQLVAMFGALVAQGEKAVASLEILISSISADLLAEVVMANMRYLPPNCPNAEGNDEQLHDISIFGSHDKAKYPQSFVAGVMSLSSTFPPVASLLDAHRSVSNDLVKSHEEEEISSPGVDSSAMNSGMILSSQNAPSPTDFPSSDTYIPGVENVSTPLPDIDDVGNLESGIPGLDSFGRIDALSETLAPSSLVSTDMQIEDASQEQVTSLDNRSPLNSVPSVSADKSEELSPKAVATDVNSLVSSTATSVVLPARLVLPKMIAPVVDLADEQKDHLQISCFMRIIDAYKQISLAGGSKVRFSILAYLGVEFPLELDPWKLLQKHILIDYSSHEGHELTLRVLYRLFGEAEVEPDFFSSTTAASVYEAFFLAVAEALRDSFPPSDKSLSKLLGESPYLPKSVLKMLENMCSPGNGDKAENESNTLNADRVTQGLSAVWSLILLRPPIRDACLKIALQSAVHHLEEVRMKAIRLVANKLYPLSPISKQIEDFAKEMLFSVMSGDASETTDAEGSIADAQKGPDIEKLTNEPVSLSGSTKDVSDNRQLSTSEGTSSLSISEAQRGMSLYFALCTKKHSLFREIFVIYRSTSKAAKQAIHRQIPILVRTLGSSSHLLEIISDPPSGSEDLLMQVLRTLTDGTIPSKDLIFTVKRLHDSKLKDAEVLIPILPFLPKDEVMPVFPNIVNLPSEKFQGALGRLLQGSSQSGPVLTPAEVLIAIHGIDPERDGIPLKKVTDACNACFEQRQTFTQEVLAKVLNQLVEQIPLPLLFMRTVLQAIGAFPTLVDFIMGILARLVKKQIWKYPKLWVGFLKCLQLTKPQSFGVLLQLPPPQLEVALNKIAVLKAPLIAHASQPDIQSSLPRSVLVVLGIVSDSQVSSQPQTSHTQTSQPQTSQPQTSQPQTSQTQTGETSNSDKDTMTEKSKESSTAS
ncbi:symplekin isoform X2 [Trifolium pratense]|uniref:symplekin isoform X2 n=1 Tax=Trifolium pratense TaxID=57577 RepID=UPI001E690F61|nr:symplekin isoform X2 [Trifolium pratense]